MPDCLDFSSDHRITPATISAAREALARPTQLAEGLPGVFYGAEFYAIERRTLFTRTWCAVTVGAAIPKVGDLLPIELAGWPILLLRGRDGQIQAFHNICRHRAMRLVSEPCSAATRIRCPWHGWTYDLTGKLLGTPEVGGAGVHSAEGLHRATLGLKPIAVGRWLDYVFVNLDGQAKPFAEHIRPLEELLGDFDFSDIRHGGRLDEVYRGNWKLATESGIEDYHLPFGHPQLDAHLSRNTTPYAAAGVFAGGAVSMGSAETHAPPGANARIPKLRSRSGKASLENYVFNIFPTGTVLITDNHVMLGMLLPDGPASTKVELHLYYDGDAAHGSEHQAAREESLARWREVLPQDFQFIEGTQATIDARDAAGIRTRFSPYWEEPVQRFQQMVLDTVV
jgi:choline monooxygenase